MRCYKATRPDGTDFRTGTVNYADALATGEPVTHPNPDLTGDASSYLSVSVSPTDCTGMAWPCRLFLVEPVGRTRKDPQLPSKWRCRGVRVVEELPAHEALGPQGERVAALIDRCSTLTADEVARGAAAWDAARDAAGDAAWAAARAAAWDAAGYAAWDAAGYAAWAAAWALAVRDLITADEYRTLVQPWASVMGWPHPDDEARYGAVSS